MNLADAIRQAAQSTGTNFVPAEAPRPIDLPNPEITLIDNTQPEPAPEHFDAVTHRPVRVPEPPAPPVAGGSVVRLELFLAPEQLNSLFRSVVATQHSVMTLREAATFLRIAPHLLEDMAEKREIPAFQIDGKWRFPRAGVDEWLTLRSAQKDLED